MTKNSDEMAFEEWFKEFSYSEYPFTEEEWEVFKKDSLSMRRARSGWQAAIAHERKRSEKLLEALNKTAGQYPPFKNNKQILHTPEDSILFAKASAWRIEIARQAIKYYEETV